MMAGCDFAPAIDSGDSLRATERPSRCERSHPTYIGTREASARAGVSDRTMREWVPRYELGLKIGGRLRVNETLLDVFLEGGEAALDAFRAEEHAS